MDKKTIFQPYQVCHGQANRGYPVLCKVTLINNGHLLFMVGLRREIPSSIITSWFSLITSSPVFKYHDIIEGDERIHFAMSS